jgi:hypothetical protein
MTQEHPITPPPELVEKWLENTCSHDCIGAYPANYEQLICTQAARWGADQELEACCEWLKAKEWIHHEFSDELRAARRPKPPSLKEQALAVLDDASDRLDAAHENIIRRALEQLDG